MDKILLVISFLGLAVACAPHSAPMNGVSGAENRPPTSSTTVQSGGDTVRGGSDGGGGDTVLPWTDSAWFVGRDRTVAACFERAADFGLTDAQVRSAILRAYGVWDGYMKLKTGDENHSEIIDLPTKVKVNDSCRGNEDLVFYFGILNAQVRAAHSEFVEPIAFAKRKDYRTHTWDSGFIWVASLAEAQRLLRRPWTEDVLVGALSHEIGHVLGCGHIAGTIMRANIIQWLHESFIVPAKVQLAMLTNVDWEDDLIEMGFNFNFNGGVDMWESSQGTEFTHRWFHELMGRDSVGYVSSRMWRTDEDFHLVIVDQAGSHDFALSEMYGVSSVNRQKTIFKIYQPLQAPFHNDPPLNESWSDVIINGGHIATLTGSKMEYFFQRGGGLDGAWEITIRPSSGGGPWPVFTRIPGGLTAKEYEAFTNRVETLTP